MAETQELLNQHREFCVSAKVSTHTGTHTADIWSHSYITHLLLGLSAHPGKGSPADPTG